jgi:hypothetical protein
MRGIDIFTDSERLEKKYTLGQAIEMAKQKAADKHLGAICLTGINPEQPLDHRITLLQMNDIIETIISDTIHHA